MIDVAEAIDAESENVTRTAVKAASGVYDVAGRWIANAPGVTTIAAAIQPARGNQLMDLPEGLRTEAQWFMWSRVAVVENDRITRGGVVYRVMYVWPRVMDGFTRCALGRVTP